MSFKSSKIYSYAAYSLSGDNQPREFVDYSITISSPFSVNLLYDRITIVVV